MPLTMTSFTFSVNVMLSSFPPYGCVVARRRGDNKSQPVRVNATGWLDVEAPIALRHIFSNALPGTYSLAHIILHAKGFVKGFLNIFFAFVHFFAKKRKCLRKISLESANWAPVSRF